MTKHRMEAFSDGVIAIVITIMVLEMQVPHGATWESLRGVWPVFVSYVMSFTYLAIYWNNHHHMLQLTEGINGGILWANMVLLFFLSLIPFTTGWMGENHFAQAPTVAYGAVLLLAACAYLNLQRAIAREQGPGSRLQRAIGGDLKGRISPILYVAAIGLAFVEPWAAVGMYALVALIWIVPDRRIESHLRRTGRADRSAADGR